MFFSIVLVVHDRYDSLASPRVLPAAIASLEKLVGDFELILVNNQDLALCPQTSSYLRKVAGERTRTKLVENGANLGCAGGFNRGVLAASPESDCLIYMSGDAMIVDAHTLSQIERVFTRFTDVGLAHPLSIYEDAEEFNYSKDYSARAFSSRAVYSDGREGAIPDNSPEEIEHIVVSVRARPLKPAYPIRYVPLTFLAVRRSVFEKVGGFDEGFLAAGENIDFTLRALKMGYSSAVINNSFVFHRRLVFRYFGQAGKDHEAEVEAQGRFTEYWYRKWKRPPIEVYREIRYGKLFYRFGLQPAYRLRPILHLLRVAKNFRHGY